MAMIPQEISDAITELGQTQDQVRIVQLTAIIAAKTPQYVHSATAELAQASRNLEVQMAADKLEVVNSHAVLQAYMQGIEATIRNGGSKAGSGGSKRPILESKAISSVKTLSSDRTTFKLWNEKLINALGQAIDGSRAVMQRLNQAI